MPDPAAVLVVDDDDDVRRLVATLLGSAGYTVHATGDPQEALWLARSLALDLVISDVTMPVLDGFALLRALQQNPVTAHLPVLFLTARAEFDDRVRAFRFGVVDYVTKPFSSQGLLLRVGRVLERREEGPARVRRDGPGAAAALLHEAQQESRSGVLSAEGPAGTARVVVQAGQVVERTGALPPDGAAEFAELDARREQILAPATSAPQAATLPEFEHVPPELRTVLVAEDDDLFRAFLASLLQGRGFEVYQARDGLEALALTLEHRPWLILTDVNMPELDGIELCRRVRQHALVRHTPVVFVSGWDDYKDRYRGLSAGADEFLSKSTPVRELLIRVQLVLRRYVELGRPGEDGEALRGDVHVVGAPGLLQMVHLGRWSGTLTARGRGGRFEARFRRGELVAAETGTRSGAEAVYDFIAWNDGVFTFVPAPPDDLGGSLHETFDSLLLEGCRRLDEAGRA